MHCPIVMEELKEERKKESVRKLITCRGTFGITIFHEMLRSFLTEVTSAIREVVKILSKAKIFSPTTSRTMSHQ